VVVHVVSLGIMGQVPAIWEAGPMTEPDSRKYNLFMLTLTILRGVILQKWYGTHEDLDCLNVVGSEPYSLILFDNSAWKLWNSRPMNR